MSQGSRKIKRGDLIKRDMGDDDDDDDDDDDEMPLVFKTNQMKSNFQGVRHTKVDYDSSQKKIEEMRKELKKKEKELEGLKASNQALVVKEGKEKVKEMEGLKALNQELVVKERKSNEELQEARKELITGLKGMLSGQTSIGVKEMGELDPNPFYVACKQKFSAEEAIVQSMKLYSLWEHHIKNPAWHPFKTIKVGEKVEEIIEEDDEKLVGLKNEWGDELYEAVTTTLLELKKDNPGDRFVAPKLWSFKEGREATLKEVVQFILVQWKTQTGK